MYAGEPVVLVGLMGTGKTTIGRLVAHRLAVPFVDGDDALERQTGHTARELLAIEGAEGMHGAEARVLLDALDAPGASVIAAAASVVLDPEIRARLGEPAPGGARRVFVIWLRAEPHWLAERVRRVAGAHRPFVDRDAGVLVRQHAERARLYQEVASLVVDVTGRDEDAIVAEIMAATEGTSGR